MTQTFHKQERLCSKKQTDLLFKSGKSLLSYPLKAVYTLCDTEMIFPAQVMFIVPKRQFKKAHERNKLKRRMREAYRLNKQIFYEELIAANRKITFAFIYVGKKEEEFDSIQKATRKLLKVISGG